MLKTFLEQAKKEGKFVLLDFNAPWCGTCPAVDHLIEHEIMPYYQEKFLLVKVNIEEYPEIAEEFNILSVPTVLLLSSEKEVIWRKSGVFKKDELTKHF